MEFIYPGRCCHDKSRRTRFQLPSTCVWGLESGLSNYTSKQYFILIECLCAWDLSSLPDSETIEQITGSWLSGYVAHVTSRSLWALQNNNDVTVICPAKFDLFAWGTYPD